jgi:V/A-type H+/Na+-transporting ATPase subunit D
MPEQVPPGRAGRLWLARRLAIARRGAELLKRKRQLLRRERDRLTQVRADTQRHWEDTCAEAERWGLRSALIGGAADGVMAAGAVAGAARVDVRWASTIGVHHAGDADVSPAMIAPRELAGAHAALAPTAAAYCRALVAAVSHAVSCDALSRVDDELRATQRRLRGIERHRLPRLEGLVALLELRLEELEREERVVSRWAQHHRRAQ